jgi:nitrate reductase gamma subunit
MKFRSLVWIGLGLIILLAAVVSDVHRTEAQAESSCVNCHETQGKNPVRAVGQWHIQHSTLACEACHGGNPAAASQEAAHAGQTTNPLEAGTACEVCHSGTAQENVAAYKLLITPEAAATAAIEPTQPGSATDAPTPMATPSVVAAAPVAPPVNPPAAGAAGFSWLKALQFTRGPLFTAAFWFFVLGMLFRLVQALRSGWKHQTAPDKQGRAAGVLKSFLTGLLVLPFIPAIKGTFRRKPVIYTAGGLFHLGLLAVILFSKTHMSAFKGQIGIGWPVLPTAAVSWLAAIGIIAMLALLINRIVDPVLRLISGPAEWLNWLVVFLPMLTGFVLARKMLLPYEVSFSIHMLLVDILLIWIPLSRISHFFFYFFSRTIHGVEFNTRRIAAP